MARSTGSDPMDEMVRLLALQVRLQIGNQEQTIKEMHKVGLGPSRIAELIGTSAGTANVAIARAKSRSKKKNAK